MFQFPKKTSDENFTGLSKDKENEMKHVHGLCTILKKCRFATRLVVV